MRDPKVLVDGCLARQVRLVRSGEEDLEAFEELAVEDEHPMSQTCL